MNKLSVTLIQSDLIWEDPSKNLKAFSEKLKSINRPTDLIILPEMFTTGFSIHAKALAQKMDGTTVNWLLTQAKLLNAVVLGSLIIEEYGNYYNRFIVAFPDGSLKHYDKHHLFTLADEHKTYTAGQKLITFDYKGWKICPLICYDLRFPIWARNTSNYDVLIYIASWPKPRIEAWDTLLKARAIENMSYVVGVNRVGTDSNKLEYPGHSVIFNCLGKKLTNSISYKEEIIYLKIEKASLLKVREKLQFLNDRDNFKFI